jgi:hypothetical protein
MTLPSFFPVGEFEKAYAGEKVPLSKSAGGIFNQIHLVPLGQLPETRLFLA